MQANAGHSSPLTSCLTTVGARGGCQRVITHTLPTCKGARPSEPDCSCLQVSINLSKLMAWLSVCHNEDKSVVSCSCVVVSLSFVDIRPVFTPVFCVGCTAYSHPCSWGRPCATTVRCVVVSLSFVDIRPVFTPVFCVGCTAYSHPCSWGRPCATTVRWHAVLVYPILGACLNSPTKSSSCECKFWNISQ